MTMFRPNQADLDRIGRDVEPISAIQDKLVTLLRERKEIGPSDIKDLLGVSRKYAIPLLEYLDRERVTRRVGDARVIL